MAVYDRIGRTYARTRTADPRIADQIAAAVGPARRVLNVGAGSGNYEPTGPAVVGLEPSPTMIRQRPPGAAPAVQGVAEHLPFPDHAFDVAMGTLTLHHWSDLGAGLAEMRRVAERQVVLFFDRDRADEYWLVSDYFPQLLEHTYDTVAPNADELQELLAIERFEVVPVPADCTDGFGCAFWNRPEAHLDPDVLAGMSWSTLLDPQVVRAGVEHLRSDLATGVWDRRYGELRALTEMDLGYRLAVAGPR